MDRATVFSGQLPRTVDFLNAQQFAMTALAMLTQAVIGTSTTVDGFTLVPTAPASLSAILSGGSIYEQEPLEATAWSALPANSTTIVKQGILLATTTLSFAPPTTTGFAQCFLIEASYLDQDDGATVLPYYNASNPQVPFNGPGNAGSANNTVRQGAIAIQVKAGIAALAGTQVAPSPDAGWAGLYVVTLAAGATTVTAGNITEYPAAPFLVAKLGQLPSIIQNDTFVGVTDQGTSANTILVTPIPAFAAYLPFQRLRVKMTRVMTGATTINVSGLGALPVVRRGGVALVGGEWAVGDYIDMVCTGTTWQLGGLSLTDVEALLSTISSSTAITLAQTLITNFPSISPPHNIVSESVAGTYTFTVPAGVTWILVTVVGGGGGGAGGGGSSTWSAGGGGSGGTCIAWIAVTPGQVITYIVGPGGAGGAQGDGAVGANGSTSSFGPSMMATGGQGGTGGTATSAGGLPGVGSSGQINLAGSPGGDGNPLNAAVQGGGGGASSQGGGGRTSTITGTQANGLAPGSGGGGIWLSDPTAQTGGHGADGLVSIQF